MSEEKNESLAPEEAMVYPATSLVAEANINPEAYKKAYKDSIENPEGFWDHLAGTELHWFEKWSETFEWNYPDYKWFVGGKLNITYNCLDRHVIAGNGDKTAYIYTNEVGIEIKISYKELLDKVCQFANGLKSLHVKAGDRVAIYMPLCLEQIVAMLGCARIGAVHSVIYAGFSAVALKLRIEDAQAKVVVASTYTKRRGKIVDLQAIVEAATEDVDCVKQVIMHQRDEPMLIDDLDIDYDAFMAKQSTHCPAVVLDSEHPLYILYTSGTTGKPKGVVHTTGGYNLYTHYTTKIIFDLKPDDIYWCTADTGWVTGHSYIVYGPLSNNATTLIYEGAPDFPDPGIWWGIIEKYKVTKFYTAPTAVRLFMKYGDEWPAKYDLSSLKILGSVGEPINPEAWHWYHKHIGKDKCTIVDTWWQTETGGHMLVTHPALPQKPGRAGLPFLGIEPMVVNRHGEPVPPHTVGLLVIKKPWPSALRTCYGEPERYKKYWNEIEGVYFAGDLATMDDDGYIMILGRSDDVLSVSGHRIGTAEVESALVSHKSVAEAAVIGKPHEIKGQSIKGFVILKHGFRPNDDLIAHIKHQVKHELGAIGVPDEIEFVDKLPKTRSGKIMRRVLLAKETGAETGDTSTLED